MFESCNTLAELSAERKRLMQNCVQAMEVNSAYNKAKARLLEDIPEIRHIPIFSETDDSPKSVVTMRIISVCGKKNELILTSQGVIL